MQPVLRAGAAGGLDLLQHAVRQQRHDARQLHAPDDQRRLQRHLLQLRGIRERDDPHHVSTAPTDQNSPHLPVGLPVCSTRLELEKRNLFCFFFTDDKIFLCILQANHVTEASVPRSYSSCTIIIAVLRSPLAGQPRHSTTAYRLIRHLLVPFRAGPHQFPPLMPPPTSSFFETYLGPSPTPMPSEGGVGPQMAGMAPTSSPPVSSGSPAPVAGRRVGDVLALLALCLAAANLLW